MRLGKREHLRGCAGKTNAPSQALAPSPSSSLGPTFPSRCLPPTPLSMRPVTLKPIPTLVPRTHPHPHMHAHTQMSIRVIFREALPSPSVFMPGRLCRGISNSHSPVPAPVSTTPLSLQVFQAQTNTLMHAHTHIRIHARTHTHTLTHPDLSLLPAMLPFSAEGPLTSSSSSAHPDGEACAAPERSPHPRG